MPTHHTTTWRSTYLLGVALLLPIGTIVLVTYFFTRMNPFNPEINADPWAFAIIAVAGGLSALMATLLALFASATYRARVRFENEYRQLLRYLNEDVARDRTRLIRNLDLVSAAQQVSMAIKQETDFERILSNVLEQLEHFARSDSITVFTLDESGTPAPRAERRNGVDRFPPALTPDAVDDSLVHEAISQARQVRELNEKTGEFVMAVYFSTPDGARGVVRIARNVADEPDFQDDMPAYEQAVGQLVRMVSLGLKTASMWDRAIKDEKTGLYNANHYGDQMRRQVAIAQRTGSPLTLIMMDIDKFKHVNDTYGHLAGDKVLAEVSAILKREARESDTPYRYGGEELCIVCCGTSEEDAAKAAERMRYKIACTEFVDERGRLLPISSSFGVAQFDPATMKNADDLKEACDRALYVAKENGRNVVVVAEGGESFRSLARSGDGDKEVKRRMGLAGDNSPLDGNEDPAPISDVGKASARAQLGESIDKLATGLADVVGSDTGRAKVVDSVVREAAEFLTRNLSARLGNIEVNTSPGSKAKRAAGPGRSTKRTNRKGSTPAGAAAEGAKKGAAPKRKRAPRKTKKSKQAEEAIRKLQAEEDAALKAESDRLDYLTNDEGEQLARGKAPSKRLRNVTRKAG
jgi:diguanylate cyclase (GGDEF)-like protein